jgi:hypothetical protein
MRGACRSLVNALRARVSDARGGFVAGPGAGSAYQVNNIVTTTDWQPAESYVQVDIHAWGSLRAGRVDHGIPRPVPCQSHFVITMVQKGR